MAHGNGLGDLYRRAVWKLIGAAALIILLLFLIFVPSFVHALPFPSPRIFPLIVLDLLQVVTELSSFKVL